MKTTSLLLAILCGICSVSQPANAEEITYRKHIRPLWETRCSQCHDSDAPYLGEFQEDKQRYIDQDLGPRMDTYADLLHFVGWPDTGAIMRRLDDGQNHPDGKPGNMYIYLGDTDQERQTNLEVFKAWIGPAAWNLNRWKQRGNAPAITKDQLERLKVAY